MDFRVALIAFSHESNTFIPAPTTLELFRQSALLEGEEVRRQYRAAHHEVGGFFEVLEAEEGVEAVPILFTSTPPWGPVADEALDFIWSRIEAGLEQAGRLDGVLLAPHGAGVTPSRLDMDGWWLSKVREKVGPNVPIISTMDPHGNLSHAMVSACDALIAYRENPHLDQRQRGVEAARLMVRTLRGEAHPVMEAAYPPVAINIERQLTAAEPMLTLIAEVDAVRKHPGVLTASLVLGFPYADVSDMGTSFIVVTHDDRALARKLANQLADRLIASRESYRGEMTSPEEALARVAELEAAAKPVGLLDMGDNVGGGSPGDSMVLAHLLEQSGRYRAFVPVVDAESVAQAEAAGVGARIRLRIGGKLPMTPTQPLEVEVTVIGLYDGQYTDTQPRHGGRTGGNMGRCAVVKSDRGLTFLLGSRRAAMTNSPEALRICDLDPAAFDLLVLRGVHAPVGGFIGLCPTFIRVNTPGVTTADMETLVYHHRRKPLFPFEAIS